MAASARLSPPSPPLSRPAPAGLTWIMAWQGLLGLGLAIGAGWLALGPALADLAPLLRYGAGLLLAAGALASLYAVWALAQRRPAGRIAAVLVDYLVAVLALLLALHWLGVFLGLDALAGTFGRGLPWLGVVFLGYLVGTLGDRFEGTRRERLPREAGRWVMLAGFLGFLYAIDAVGGLVWLAGQLVAQPAAAGLLVLAAACAGVLRLAWGSALSEYLNASHMQEELLNGYIFLSPN